MVLITLAFISEWQTPHRFHFIVYQNQHRVTADEHPTEKGGAIIPDPRPCLSLLCAFILLSICYVTESWLHHSHHFLFQWKISLKINTLWLAAAKKNRSVNQKNTQRFQISVPPITRVLPRTLGTPTLEPFRDTNLISE